MDTRKQYGAETEQESSDDLIAELARLVGEEAPSRGRPESAERSEPSFAPQTSDEASEAREPAIGSNPDDRAPVAPVQSERSEPALTQTQPQTPQPAPQDSRSGDAFEFDFGFGTHAQPQPAPAEPAAPENDPIGSLIADADAEAARSALESDSETPAGSETSAPHADWQTAEAPAAPAPQARPEPTAHAATQEGEGVRDDQIRERDPLSEIEALIGQAARVNLDSGPMGTRRVRSVYSNDGTEAEGSTSEPYESADRETPANEPDSAEEAILAAAAATGASVHRAGRERPSEVHPEAGRAAPDLDFTPSVRSAPVADAEIEGAWDDTPETDPALAPAAKPRKRRRYRQPGMMMPALLGTLIVAGIAGGYFVFFGEETQPGEAPVLVADSEPAKSVPEATNTTGTTNESVVFSDMEGSASAATASSQLVSRDQTDGATGSAVSNIIASEDGDSGLVNRRVRTVTVRPDGTIVSGDAAEAGSSVLPVDRPNVPQVASDAADNDPIGAAITQAMSGGTGNSLTTQSTGASSNATQDVAETDALDGLAGIASEGTAESATDATLDGAATEDASIQLPTPRPASSDEATAGATPSVADLQGPLDDAAAAPSTEQTAETTADSEAAAAPRTDIPVIGAWVQLSSQRSEEAARQGLPELQSRYGDLFNGAQPVVDRADLGQDGVYYRVRLPQPNFEAATSVCNAIKAQGGDCFVLNG